MSAHLITFLATNGDSLVSAVTTNWLTVLVAFILAVFGGGGISTLIKVRKEGANIMVDAAQGAVVVQSSVIKNLRVELEDQRNKFEAEGVDLRAEIAELRTHLAELNSLRTRVRELEQQNEILTAENIMLSSQVKALSKMVHEQEKRNGQNAGTG